MLNEKQFCIYNNLIKQVYQTYDLKHLRWFVLDKLKEIIPYDNAAFFLVNPETSNFLDPYTVGLDQKRFHEYKDYYEDKDIYKQSVFNSFIPPVDRSSDYMNYREWSKNEHRSDFLLAQNIYYIACLQIFYHGRLAGEISLHRNINSPDFSNEEMLILKMLHDHMNNAFLNLSLIRNELPVTEKIYDEKNNVGICLIDSRYNILIANSPAQNILRQKLITGQDAFSYVKENCQQMLIKQSPQQLPFSHLKIDFLYLRDMKLPYRIINFENVKDTGESFFIVIIQDDDYMEPNNLSNCKIFELTRREKEIASLIARGNTNKQIAYHLSISENTVKTYIRRVFAKTQVTSRAELIYQVFK